MREYLIKQKLRFGGERFEIFDQEGRIAYQASGSFLQIPKSFLLRDAEGRVVSSIQKEILTFFPTFKVEMKDGKTFCFKKGWSFFRDRYRLSEFDYQVRGNIWDLDFQLLNQNNQVIAEISKEVFHITDHYSIRIYDEALSEMVLTLVVAIDYVEALENK